MTPIPYETLDLPPQMYASNATQERLDENLKSTSDTITDTLKKNLNPDQLKVVLLIGYYLSMGLSVNDACVVAHVDISDFESFAGANPDIKRFVKFKETAYKAKLVGSLSEAAFTGKDKIAGYLLEKRFRDEYGNERGDGSEDRADDMVAEAIRFIRASADQNPVVVRALPTAKTP